MKKLFLLFALGGLISLSSCGGDTQKNPVSTATTPCYDTATHKFLVEPILIGSMNDNTTLVYLFDFDSYDNLSLSYFPKGGKDEMYLVHFEQFQKAHAELFYDCHQAAIDKKGVITFWKKKPQYIEPADDPIDSIAAAIRKK